MTSAPPVETANEPLPPVADTLPVRLMRAREAVMIRLRPVLRLYNVTEQQWRVLRTIFDLEETEVTLLAARVFLLAPSLSRILRDLEQRGLVVRRTSHNDQRRALVSLSPAGLALIAEARPHLAEIARQNRELYGPERMDALHHLLSELEAVLGPAPAGEGHD